MGSANEKPTRGDIVLNVYRDTGEGNFLNRVCTDEATDVSPTDDNIMMMLMYPGDQILLRGR
jgi:hypothetical protein